MPRLAQLKDFGLFDRRGVVWAFRGLAPEGTVEPEDSVTSDLEAGPASPKIRLNLSLQKDGRAFSMRCPTESLQTQTTFFFG